MEVTCPRKLSQWNLEVVRRPCKSCHIGVYGDQSPKGTLTQVNERIARWRQLKIVN